MKKLFLSFLIVSLFIFSVGVLADNTVNDPATCSGEWTNCNNAFSDGGGVATATKNEVGIWQDYGFNIDPLDEINYVQVRVDFFASKTNGFVDIQVSNNSGTNFGSAHRVGGNTAEQTFLINVTDDFNWNADDLSDANFRVKATCVKQGQGSPPTCSLDYIPVNATHTPPPVCTRGDPNVLISPSSDNGTAGETLQYTVDVTNGDTSVCGSSDFDLSSEIPTGWTDSFGTDPLTIGPGATEQSAYNITSNVLENPGVFLFNITAQNLNSLDTGTDGAIYVVVQAFGPPQSQMNDPTTCNGQWNNCNNAFADGGGTATVTKNKDGNWEDYGFNISLGSIIDEVIVRTDFFATRTNGHIDVRVSNDGGFTYGPAHRVGGNTAEQTFFINVTSDFNWDANDFINGNFLVNATCIKQGGGPNPTCNLDYIPVNATFREPI